MKYILFSEASNIYNCGNDTRILRHSVNSPVFKQFCLYLKQFEKLLGDASGDGFWMPLLLKLKRYRFEMSASPLPFDHPAIYTPSIVSLLAKTKQNCRKVYPGFEEHLDRLTLCLRSLAESADNPLLDFLTGLLNCKGLHESALLLKESRLLPLTDEIIFTTTNSNVDCINIQQYRGPKCYQMIVVIGPSRWYPDYIFSAPRAAEIHLLSYSWIMDKWEPRTVFPQYPGENFPEIRKVINDPDVPDIRDLPDGTYISWDDILPDINWEQISSVISQKYFQDGTDAVCETIEAKLFLLEGQAAVFLDSNAKVLVIDFDEDEDDDEKEDTRVKRILAADVQEEMYLLLRTSGGGEYLVPVADLILGVHAQKARDCQKHWKTLLQEQVNRKGAQAVSNGLKLLGSVRANEINVRNWMGDRNIKPADYSDFEAIMKYIELENNTPEYWKMAEAIDEAHRKAGFHIRKLLLNQVLSADLSLLEKTGMMDFELEKEDGGSLTAFRVIGISPDGYTIPLAKVGHPFERGE